MPSQWYSNQGPSAAHAHPQHPMNPSHYGRMYYGAPGAPGAPENGQQNQPYHNRSSPPILHPAPSNSSAPTSAAPGPVSGNAANNHAPIQSMSSSGAGMPQPHFQHHGVHPNGHYSLPGSAAAPNAHLIRPVPRGPGPVMQHSYHMTHHDGAGHPQRVPGHGGLPHQNMANFPPVPSNFHYGANHHHMGRVQNHVHHLGPHHGYASMGNAGSAGPYYQGGHIRDNSMHHNMPHHHPMHGQLHHADHQFQRVARNFESPMNTSIDHSAIRQSPSPPPAPPSTSTSDPSNNNSPAMVERVVSVDSTSPSAPAPNTDALKEQTNQADKTKERTSKEKVKQTEDFTADAASILLQLGAMVKKPESPRGNNKTMENDSNDSLNDPIATVTPVNEGPLTIEPTTSCDATAEDSTPGITSKPSHDSVDSAVSTESDFPAPIPENYPRRLALPQDDSKLNSLHCFLRSDLLDIFVVQKSQNKSPTHSPGSSVGRVGLRCVHCAMTRKSRDDRDEAPMAVFYPKSIAEIYRLVTSWQRCHLRKCRNLPPGLRSQWQALRESDKSRGKTHYWVTSAKQIGLVDCYSRAGGIRFDPAVVDAFNKKQCQPVAPKDTAATLAVAAVEK
ncbi:unnamed protein product [Cylindrotheca closterium]|uniref:Uncharacterized protein n=1 Tax=Cylindrotheca closterium TaxID=2856 RepID=A0AAD2CM88_9STRA|nr:unnamed protein product [Cylindrotheca closterium]